MRLHLTLLLAALLLAPAFAAAQDQGPQLPPENAQAVELVSAAVERTLAGLVPNPDADFNTRGTFNLNVDAQGGNLPQPLQLALTMSFAALKAGETKLSRFDLGPELGNAVLYTCGQINYLVNPVMNSYAQLAAGSPGMPTPPTDFAGAMAMVRAKIAEFGTALTVDGEELVDGTLCDRIRILPPGEQNPGFLFISKDGLLKKFAISEGEKNAELILTYDAAQRLQGLALTLQAGAEGMISGQGALNYDGQGRMTGLEVNVQGMAANTSFNVGAAINVTWDAGVAQDEVSFSPPAGAQQTDPNMMMMSIVMPLMMKLNPQMMQPGGPGGMPPGMPPQDMDQGEMQP